MSQRLEHANICVRDIDGMIRFLQIAFPDFKIRFDGKSEKDTRWVHIGTDETYIALNQAVETPDESWIPYSGRPGVNHLAYVVDDAEALRKRLASAGYKDSTVPNKHPHRTRVYFYDPEGNDWEFIQYLSDDPAQQNDYNIPDR